MKGRLEGIDRPVTENHESTAFGYLINTALVGSIVATLMGYEQFSPIAFVIIWTMTPLLILSVFTLESMVEEFAKKGKLTGISHKLSFWVYALGALAVAYLGWTATAIAMLLGTVVSHAIHTKVSERVDEHNATFE